MHQFARTIGMLSLAAGTLLLAFPDAAKRVMDARAEFAQLSPNALRLLGGWELLVGVLLVSVTTKPMVEIKTAGLLPPDLHKIS